MTRKIRLIILVFCMLCFFVIAPILVAYSMGYRFDFENMKITLTGGIYIKTNPGADQIIIDSQKPKKPNWLSNSLFVQSLLPKNHTVLIKKTDYYDYSKTLPVREKEVTILENILLIKKNLKFETISDPSPFDTPEKFIIKNSNLYYSNAPENAIIAPAQKSEPVIKNIIAFKISNSSIFWLGADGFLYQSDSLGQNPQKLTATALKITQKSFYKISISGQNILLNNNGNMLIYSKNKGDFENFPITASYGKITNCLWLNNYYVVFSSEGKIVISETDPRGNINAVTLPVETKNPQIYFSQQEGKLYILENETILVSEKIIP